MNAISSSVRSRLLAATIVVASFAPAAFAGELSKEQCVAAHSEGQDAKAQNRLSLARKLFMTCAQQGCPALVQGDCARFANELSQLQPSISLIARDGSGGDLPDTTVYIDDALVVTRLDGNLHDVDPGKHVIKFQNGNKEQVQTIVIGSGEKGRAIVATFGSPTLPSPRNAAAAASTDGGSPAPRTTHARLAKPLIYGGAVLAAGGTALAVVGFLRIPAGCSLSTHQCAAPPHDPALDDAGKAIRLANYGLAIGVVGLAAAATGVVWYYRSAKSDKEHLAVAPWVGASAGGFAVSGAL